jgi:excisionase family DNA binding protein
VDERSCKHRQPEATRLPHLLDIPKLAEHLGVTDRHVRRLVDERRIPYVRWGRRIRFDPDEVARWLEAARVDPLVEHRGLLTQPLRPVPGRRAANR